MKKAFLPLIALACLAFYGCATSIPVQAIKPAELDLRGIKTIAVLPFAYPTQGRDPDLDPYQAALESLWLQDSEDQDPASRDLARAAERIFIQTVEDTGLFRVISPEELSATLDPSSPAAGIDADAVVVGNISLVSIVNDYPYKGASGKTIHSYTNAVFVGLSFEIYRGDSDRIAASREIRDSITFKKLPDKQAVSDTTQKATEDIVSAWPESIRRAFAPHSMPEERYLADGGKDSDMEKAMLLVQEGSYRGALDLYTANFRKTGLFAAGYNAAIMKELLGDIDGAIADMDELARSFPKSKAASEAFRMRASLAAGENTDE